jgi:hypothetical protein
VPHLLYITSCLIIKEGKQQQQIYHTVLSYIASLNCLLMLLDFFVLWFTLHAMLIWFIGASLVQPEFVRYNRKSITSLLHATLSSDDNVEGRQVDCCKRCDPHLLLCNELQRH